MTPKSETEIELARIAKMSSREYPEGTYALTIKHAYLVDIKGTVEDDNCAEVYGTFSVIQDGKKYTYFTAPQKSPARVCEKDAPLNRGKQVGDLPRNGTWENDDNNTILIKGASASTGWVLEAELHDEDTTTKDDLICKGRSELLRPGSGRTTAGVWTCEGEGKLVVEWAITDVGGRDLTAKFLDNDRPQVVTKLPDLGLWTRRIPSGRIRCLARPGWCLQGLGTTEQPNTRNVEIGARPVRPERVTPASGAVAGGVGADPQHHLGPHQDDVEQLAAAPDGGEPPAIPRLAVPQALPAARPPRSARQRRAPCCGQRSAAPQPGRPPRRVALSPSAGPSRSCERTGCPG